MKKIIHVVAKMIDMCSNIVGQCSYFIQSQLKRLIADGLIE